MKRPQEGVATLKKARRGVPQQNGSRQYLANAVQALETRVAAAVVKVERADVALSQLIEAEKRARDGREKMWSAIEAMRAEQQQVAMSISGVPAAIEKLSSKVSEIDEDRKQAKTIFSFVSVSAKFAWWIGGVAWAALLAISAYLFKFGPTPPPSPPHP